MDSLVACRYAPDMTALDWMRGRSRVVLALTLLAMVGGLILAFWLLFHHVRPAPPRTVTMVTGAPGGAYALYGERYRQALAREGIELVLRSSSGSIENLRVLMTEPGIELGFIQGGIANDPESRDLMLLGSMYFEPVWLFHRLDEPLTRLTQLEGRRVAVGAFGSGTQLLALQLLATTDLAVDSPGWLPVGGEDAAVALLEGRIDAAFMIAGADAPTVRKLLAGEGIRIAELDHVDAYARRIPQLTVQTLPAGAIDLAGPNPPRDLRLLGATANLVARSDLHPAIISLLMQSAREIHGTPGLLQQAGEYPNIRTRDLPPSGVAQRFLETGPSFLQRYLPFWLAVLADRLLVSLLPLIAVMIPLMRVAPALYAWRMRSRIYRWYGELKFLEQAIHDRPDADRTEDYLAQLDRLEERANHIRIPLAYNNELYTLREHIQLVRRKLLGHMADLPEQSRT